jgi:raffinose/stachyose/melibiose transport system substrate-binding protein
MRIRTLAASMAALTLASGIGTAAVAQSPAAAPVTLTAWIGPVFSDAQKKQLTDWEAATGNTIETEVFPLPFEQNVLTKWATGERPDLLFFHAIGNWLVQLDPEANLQDLSGEPFVQRTIPGILDKAGSYNGKNYAAVLNYPYLDGVFYNKPLFEKHGWQQPKSFADLLTLCATIKTDAPDVAPINAGGGDQWPLQVPAFMMWNDALKADPDLIGKVNRNEASFADPVFVDGISKLKELQDKGCLNSDVLTSTFNDQQQGLIDGTTAMVFQGSWMSDSMKDSFGIPALDANVGFFGLSTDSDTASWQTVGTGSVYAPKTGDASREAAARQFIDWATGDDYGQFLQDSKQFPIIQGYDVPEGVAQVQIEANDALLANSVPQFQQTLEAAYGAFETFLQEMIAGQKTPQDVGDALDDEFTKSAQDLGLPGF